MKSNDQSFKKVIVFFSFTILIIFGMTTCSGTDNSAKADKRNRLDFTDKTEQKTISFDIRPGMRNNKLHLNVHLDSGSCSWKLIDPNGSILWQDSISGNTNFNKMRDLPRTTGEWRLEISLENASGKYDIKWNGAK